MGFLSGKRALITGIASHRSIAWGIAQAMHAQGAELAFTYQNERLKERVDQAAAEFGGGPVLACDVAVDGDVDRMYAELAQSWDGFDILVHSIAYAPREQIQGRFIDAVTREGFNTAHEISSYSFAALAKGARGLMKGRNGALITLSYLGAGPGPRRHSRQRDLRRPDQDPSSGRNRQLPQDAGPCGKSLAAAP
jgi:enoyl-[acyl-carrier protein] reductase I